MSARFGRALALGALVAACSALGCGYRIVGVGGQLPGGFTRVEVPVFENNTPRTDVGRILTGDFISQLLGAAKVRVAAGEQAQAVILGKVTAYKRDPISFDSANKPLENRLTITMDVSLVSREDRRVLFAETGVTVRSDYNVRGNLTENDRLEDEALRDASRLMSEKLVGLMLESF